MRLKLALVGCLGLVVGVVGYEVANPGGQFVAMQPRTFNCDTDSECANLPPCKLKLTCDGGPNTEPFRLVGYDCQWALGPIYRDEEDEFPKCGRIEGVFAND